MLPYQCRSSMDFFLSGYSDAHKPQVFGKSFNLLYMILCCFQHCQWQGKYQGGQLCSCSANQQYSGIMVQLLSCLAQGCFQPWKQVLVYCSWASSHTTTETDNSLADTCGAGWRNGLRDGHLPAHFSSHCLPGSIKTSMTRFLKTQYALLCRNMQKEAWMHER